mgnify:CR=1 FL=1
MVKDLSRGFILSATVAVLGAQAGYAQDTQERGSELRFGLSIETRAEENASLSRPAESATHLIENRVTVGYSRRTATSTFDIGGGISGFVGHDPSGDFTEFRSPNAYLTYEKLGKDSRFRATTRADSSEIDSLVTVVDPDTGELSLTADPGRRTTVNQTVTLSLMEGGPLELDFGASSGAVRYEDTLSSSYYDSDRASGKIDARFKLSPNATLSTGVAFSGYEADNADSTIRENRSATVGLDMRLDSRTEASFGVGYSEVETWNSGQSDLQEGGTFSAGISRSTETRKIGLNYDHSITATGARDSLTAAYEQSYTLSRISAELGYAMDDNGDGGWIGSVDYFHELQTGDIKLSLSRDITTSDNNQDRFTTQVSADWRHTLNETSSVALRVVYAEVEYLTADIATTGRGQISASYSQQINRDWNVTAGIGQRRAIQTGLDDAVSNFVFVRLNREFSIRP